MSSRYDVLFQAVRIGPLTAKNRFIASPHNAGMGYTQPHASAAFRGMKAEGGWGIVCSGMCEIDATSDMMGHHNDRLWDEADVAAHRISVDAIHQHGALAGIELAHAGLRARNLYSRTPLLGPAALKSTAAYVPVQSRAMDKADIKTFRDSHRRAALRAKAAGYDLVYVYAAHDLALPMHFLSRRYNDRTDEYGGSLKNRARLLREVLEDTKEAVGDTRAVALRFSVYDFDGRISREEGEETVGLLAELPDLWDVNVSPWSYDSGTSRFFEEGYQEPYIAFVKKLTTKPVVGVGRFTSPDAMVSQIRRGILDFIGAARPSIADPFLPEKIRDGRIDEIRECIGCNVCVSTETYGVPIRCTQNPTIAEEWRSGWHPERVPPCAEKECALVVGGGPAGLECAMTLARQGFSVALAEKSDELGGRLRWESRLPGQATWRRVSDHRLHYLKTAANVELFLQSDLTDEDIMAFGADHVFIATGAEWRADGAGPSMPNGIPGLEAVNTISAPQAFDQSIDGPVVIFDDDHYYLGHAIAEMLSARGLGVALVTPAPDVSQWSYYTQEMRQIEARLHKAKVALYCKSKIIAVQRGEIVIETGVSGTRTVLPCRTFIPITLRQLRDDLFTKLTARSAEWAEAGIRSVCLIGDASGPGTVAAAIHSGHRAARLAGSPSPQDTETLFARERTDLSPTSR